MNKNDTLDPTFYQEEVLCDYVVSAKQKKVWAIELDLLDKLLNVCQKHNIRVYAYGGTILGAVRHQGFIPWDDDIDVCLLHDDYIKLLKIAESEFQSPYFFQTALTDRNYYFRYARLRNSDTTGFINEYSSREYNQGIFIDIFILNGYQSNPFLLQKQLFEMTLAWKACRAYIADLSEKKWYKRPFIGLFQAMERLFFSYEQLINWSWSIQSRYDKTSNKVTLLTHGKAFMKKYWCELEGFKNPVYKKFEYLMLPIPSNYEAFLEHAYGNYMAYPPIEERGKWHQDVIVFEPDIPYKEYIRRSKNLS